MSTDTGVLGAVDALERLRVGTVGGVVVTEIETGWLEPLADV